LTQKKNRKDVVREKRARELARREYINKLKPLLLAFVVWFVLLSVLHLPFIKDYLRTIMVTFTQQSALVLGKMFFLPMTTNGYPRLSYDGFTMNVILECTAYNFYLFVIVVTVFARWSLKDKLVNLAVFLGVIFLMNNLRFFVMGAVGRHYPAFFDHIHDFVWNILFGILVFLIYFWADRRAGGVFAPIPEAKTA
jgi:exosortase/archaeosortase family protein